MISVSLQAQTEIAKELKADINRYAGMFYTRSLDKMPKDTPPPAGKKPFYINHYGCPGAYYLDKQVYYTDTYAIFAQADTNPPSPRPRVLSKAASARPDSPAWRWLC